MQPLRAYLTREGWRKDFEETGDHIEDLMYRNFTKRPVITSAAILTTIIGYAVMSFEGVETGDNCLLTISGLGALIAGLSAHSFHKSDQAQLRESRNISNEQQKEDLAIKVHLVYKDTLCEPQNHPYTGIPSIRI